MPTEELATDKSFISGTLFSGIGLAIGNILTLVVGIIIAWALGPEGVGFISISNYLVLLIATICLLGFPDAVAYYVAHSPDQENKKQYLTNALILVIVLGIFGTLLLVFISGFVASIFQLPPLAIYLTTLAYLMPVFVIFTVLSNFLRGMQKFRIYAITLAAPAIVLFILQLSFWLLGLLNILTAVWNIVFATLFVSIPLMIKLLGNIKPRSLSRSTMGYLTRMGFPLMITAFFAMIIDATGVLLIALLTTDINITGIYSNAYGLAVSLRFLIEPIALSLLPIITVLFAQKKLEEANTQLDLSMRFFLLLVTLLICVSILGQEIMQLLYGPLFAVGGIFLSILSLGVVGLMLFYQFARAITGAGKTVALGLIILVSAILNLVLCFLTIQIIGPVGAAFSSVCVFILMAALSVVYSYRLGFRITIPKRMIAALFVTGIITFVGYFLLNGLMIWFNLIGLYRDIAIIFGVFFIAFLTLFIVKPFSQEEYIFLERHLQTQLTPNIAGPVTTLVRLFSRKVLNSQKDLST